MQAIFRVLEPLKKLVFQILAFFKSDVDLRSYLWTFLFLSTCCTINYIYLLDDTYLEPLAGTWSGFGAYFAFYSFAYYGVALPVLGIRKQQELLKLKAFWLCSLFFLICIAADGAMAVPQSWIQFLDLENYEYWARRCMHQWQSLVFWIPAFALFKMLFQSEAEIGLYGIRAEKDDLKPYLTMLWIMIPLIALASFLPDFQIQYPTFKRLIPHIPGETVFGRTLALLGYEIPYIGSFLTTEMMFRGGLGLGLSVILGRHALLPMVSVYMFLHFGKPLGESVSSVFGGYILGILAIQNRNIWGGFFIHGVVALLMDLAATWQTREQLFKEW